MQDIKRKQAASLLEELAELAANELQHNPKQEWALAIRDKFLREGLSLPTPCRGEAHSNAHIDNCGVCMPRWGWVFTGKGYRIP